MINMIDSQEVQELKKDKSVKKHYALTRADFVQYLKIPETTEDCIIIPCEQNGLRFQEGHYKEEYLQDLMSQEEFDKIVRNFTRILYKSYSMKRNIDNREVTFQNKFLFITAFVLLTLGFSFLYWGILIASYSVKSSGSGLLVGALIVGGWPYLKYIRGRLDEFPTLEGIVTEQLGVYVGTLNQQMVQRGLFWNAVPGYFWLELHVDRLVLKQNTEIGLCNTQRNLLGEDTTTKSQNKNRTQQDYSGQVNSIFIIDEEWPENEDFRSISDPQEALKNDNLYENRDAFFHKLKQLRFRDSFTGKTVKQNNKQQVDQLISNPQLKQTAHNNQKQFKFDGEVIESYVIDEVNIQEKSTQIKQHQNLTTNANRQNSNPSPVTVKTEQSNKQKEFEKIQKQRDDLKLILDKININEDMPNSSPNYMFKSHSVSSAKNEAEDKTHSKERQIHSLKSPEQLVSQTKRIPSQFSRSINIPKNLTGGNQDKPQIRKYSLDHEISAESSDSDYNVYGLKMQTSDQLMTQPQQTNQDKQKGFDTNEARRKGVNKINNEIKIDLLDTKIHKINKLPDIPPKPKNIKLLINYQEYPQLIYLRVINLEDTPPKIFKKVLEQSTVRGQARDIDLKIFNNSNNYQLFRRNQDNPELGISQILGQDQSHSLTADPQQNQNKNLGKQKSKYNGDDWDEELLQESSYPQDPKNRAITKSNQEYNQVYGPGENIIRQSKDEHGILYEGFSEAEIQENALKSKRDQNNIMKEKTIIGQNNQTQYLEPPLQRNQTIISRQTLITRSDFMSHIQIPRSNQNRIIIPSNSIGNSFKKNTYEEQFLHNILTKQEFDKVIDHICKIAHKSHSKKRLYDNTKMSNEIINSFIFAFMCEIVFVVLYYYATIYQSILYKWLSLGFLIFGLVFVLSMMGYHALPTKPLPSFESMVKDELDNYFTKINKQFVLKGLWWRVVPGHYWVECRIDKSLKEDIQKIEELQNHRDGYRLTPPENNKYSIIYRKDDSPKKGSEEVLGIKLNAKLEQSHRRKTQIIYYQDIASSLDKSNMPAEESQRELILKENDSRSQLQSQNDKQPYLGIANPNKIMNNINTSYNQNYNDSFRIMNPNVQHQTMQVNANLKLPGQQYGSQQFRHGSLNESKVFGNTNNSLIGMLRDQNENLDLSRKQEKSEKSPVKISMKDNFRIPKSGLNIKVERTQNKETGDITTDKHADQQKAYNKLQDHLISDEEDSSDSDTLSANQSDLEDQDFDKEHQLRVQRRLDREKQVQMEQQKQLGVHKKHSEKHQYQQQQLISNQTQQKELQTPQLSRLSQPRLIQQIPQQQQRPPQVLIPPAAQIPNQLRQSAPLNASEQIQKFKIGNNSPLINTNQRVTYQPYTDGSGTNQNALLHQQTKANWND
eukprot:403374297